MADDASSASSDSRTSDPSSSSSSNVLRWTLYVISGFVGLVLLAAVVLPQIFPPERLKRIVVPQVENAVQRDVTIGSIGLRVLPFPTVRITDFTIANDSTFAARGVFTDEPAIQGDALNVDLALWPLFTATIEPTSIELVRPVVRYQIAEDGATNFDTFAATDSAEVDTSESAMPVSVSDFRLTEARVLYDDRSTGQWAKLGFTAQLRAVPGENPQAIDSRGTIEDLTLAYVSEPDADTTALQNATVDYDALANTTAGTIDIRNLKVSTPPIGLAMTGSIREMSADRPVVDLAIETTDADLAQLAAIVPGGVGEGVAPRGTLNLNVAMQGPLPDSTGSTEGLSLTGDGSLSGVGVDVDGTTMLADLGAALSISLESIAVNNIEGRLLGKPLSGQVTVSEPLADAPQLNGQLAGAADLAELSSLAAEEGGETVDIAGAVDYDIRFSGPATDTDAIRVRGPITLANVRVPNESLREPLEIDDATIQLTGTGLQADRFQMRSGETTMQLGFTVQDLLPVSRGLAETNPAVRIAFNFSSDEIDLVELMPEEDGSAPTYADLFTAQLAGTRVDGRPAEEVAQEVYGDVELPAYRVNGDVRIGTLLNDPQRFDNLTFDVNLRNRRLEVPNLSAKTYGGTLAGSIVLDQSAAATSAYVRPASQESVLMASARGGIAPRRVERLPMPATPTALSYNFELTGAKASAFLRDWTTLGEFVNGTMDFSIDGSSPLTSGLLPVAQALTAGGRSLVADGGFSSDFALPAKLVDKLGVSKPSFSNFKQFGGPFTIEDGELKIGEWDMQNNQVQTSLSGAFGLGGTVDLDMTAEMPLSMVRGSKLSGQTGGILDRLSGKDGTVPVGISVGGTISEPTFTIDTSALQDSLKELLPRGLRRLID
ncbi:hypothetical protein CRI94_16610 [Longibacter salinarum]|uniref:AsmA family protein n=1 Tax=Longibacter salinarum TaxID=1850348 RepID=A0A2A8CTZ3_9BACT|nr:AsmA family protein [Longibacter salinarum]PEN11207.1 hypothetical protein CRI94_16610 [Longibacter salinarum]